MTVCIRGTRKVLGERNRRSRRLERQTRYESSKQSSSSNHVPTREEAVVTENPMGTGDSSRNVLPEPSLVGIASLPAEAISRETDLCEVLPVGESSSEGTRARKRGSTSESHPPEESGSRYNLRRRGVTHFSNSILNLSNSNLSNSNSTLSNSNISNSNLTLSYSNLTL